MSSIQRLKTILKILLANYWLDGFAGVHTLNLSANWLLFLSPNCFIYLFTAGYVKKSATTGISKNNIVVETDFCICEKVIYKIHNRFLKREPSCSINLHGTENWTFQQFCSIEKLYLAVSKVLNNKKTKQIPPGKTVWLCETNKQTYHSIVYFCLNFKIKMSTLFC